MPTLKKKSLKVNVKNNSKFFFLTEILNLESLHYGYWDKATELTLENVKEAQKRYTDTLIEMIPKDVNDILDVGCGIGDISFALAKEGYNVSSLSPDINHKPYFEDNIYNIQFYNLKFEELRVDQKYDLILMSESQNYFDTNIGLSQCKKYLRDGGFLLISGMFRKKRIDLYEKVRNIEGEYLNLAKKYNLNLIEKIEITKNVLPTLKYAYDVYHKFITPSLRVLYNHFGKRTKFKIGLLKIFFIREFKLLVKTKEYYEERLDPDLFDRHIKYLRLLFKKE